MAKQKTKVEDFPESLFDERLRCEPFDIGDDIDIEVDDKRVDFIGWANPDYDPDYIPPDDGIPF